MDRRQRWLKRAPVIGGVLLVVLLVSALAWFIHGFMAYKTQNPERVQEVTLIRPPPPPPPPETPPPPPPEKIQQPIEQKQPEPTPDKTPAPPQQQLGLDTTGTAGGDSFGLVARAGGSDLIGSGGAAFAWYTGKLKDAVSDRLTSDPKLHAQKFTVNVRLWIAADGHIKQVRLAGSSGNAAIDGEISAALRSMANLDEAPPIEMPQPITLQIVGRS
jgi:periplasmic protein TonB